jgi:hypothetical protein
MPVATVPPFTLNDAEAVSPVHVVESSIIA